MMLVPLNADLGLSHPSLAICSLEELACVDDHLALVPTFDRNISAPVFYDSGSAWNQSYFLVKILITLSDGPGRRGEHE